MVLVSGSITLARVNDGEKGTSVSSIAEEYYLSTSKTTQTGGSWVTTPPTWSTGKYMWTRSKIVYANPASTVYTTPVCDSSWEAVNEVHVGGRNLFKGYDETEIQLNNYQNTGSFTQFANKLTFDPCETVGETYTIGLWAKSPNGTATLQIYNNNGQPRHFYFSPKTLTTTLGNEWEFFSIQVTNADRGETYADTYCNRIEIYAPNQMGVLVKKIKVEKGNKATDWTPAPEDVQGQIDTSIKTVDVEYYLSTSQTSLSGGSWQTTAPTWVNGKYMWSRTKTTLNDGTVSYKPSENGTCIAGAKGDTGEKGETGDDGRTQYLHIKYSDDGVTFTANNGETLGAYIGTLVDFNELDSTTFSDYTWKKFTEDVDEELGTLTESITQLQAGINEAEGRIDVFASKSYVEQSQFNTYTEETNTILSTMPGEIRAEFNTQIDEVNEKNGDLERKYTEINKYIRFVDGDIILGSSENPITLTIENDRISFKKNGLEFGWWDGDNFHTGNIVVEVEERAQFGNFAFIPRNNGSLSFLKVGG